MAVGILIVLLSLPLIEIAGFIVVGERLGVVVTLTLTVATAVVGLATIRFQGGSLAARARAAFARDEPPVVEAIEGLALALAGVLLLVPGFFTDLLGALLLIPPLRLWAVGLVLDRLARRVAAHSRSGDDEVIDGTFRDVTPHATRRRLTRRHEDRDR
jgi:UPF0716 protein FxsA